MRIAVGVVVAWTLASAASARADVVMHHRVVLVAMPDLVFSATAAALGPWSIAVEATAGPVPADDDAARVIAHDHDASAVAWLDGAELVIYDDLRGSSERRAAPLPTDDVTAAAIALSIKTALRRPVAVVPLPMVVEVPSPPPWQEAPPVVIPPPPPPPPAERRVHLAGHLGVGLPAAIHVDARVAFDLPIGSVVLAVGAGARSTIDTPQLRGSYRELVGGAGVAASWPLRYDLAVTPSALATVHVSHLDGTVEGGDAVGSTQVTPGVEAAVALDRRAGAVRLGGLLTTEVLLRPTRYQVEGMDALVIPRLVVGLALRVSF